MKYLISLFLLTAMTNCLNATPSVNMEQWRQFKAEYGKVYETPEEENKRMALFFENVAMVEEHNEAFERGEETFDMKLNHFSDMLPEEIYSSYMMAMDFETLSKSNGDTDGMINKKWVPPVGVQAPDSVDWRTKGYVTSVKGQRCGNCYTYAAIGSLEGQVAKHTGVLTSLSTQQLTDCTRHGNYGCNGGTVENAYRDVFSYGGIETDEDYPAMGREQTCQFNESAVAAKISGFWWFDEIEDEELLKLAVATLGPISSYVSVNYHKFLGFGNKGVYYNSTCSDGEINHGVLIVGYGTLNGTDYWLVKNSWGLWFGDEGYIRMARNRENNCWIGSHCNVPILNTNSTF